jgi:hypothetical protein
VKGQGLSNKSLDLDMDMDRERCTLYIMALGLNEAKSWNNILETFLVADVKEVEK